MGSRTWVKKTVLPPPLLYNCLISILTVRQWQTVACLTVAKNSGRRGRFRASDYRWMPFYEYGFTRFDLFSHP